MYLFCVCCLYIIHLFRQTTTCEIFNSVSAVYFSLRLHIVQSGSHPSLANLHDQYFIMITLN